MDRPRYTALELVTTTGGAWSGKPPEAAVAGVCDNSGKVTPGCLFIAIKGETADGHNYLPQAITAGARVVCVQQPLPPAVAELAAAHGVACLRVPDTLVAFHALAAAYRRQFKLPIIGVTGSSGKTSTRALLQAILEYAYPGTVLATEGNTNNHFGVPRNLFRLTSHHQVGILELGTNHPGEIATLAAMVQPTVGVVVNVGTAHIEFFLGREGIAQEKGSLFSSLPSDGTCIFPADCPQAGILRQLAGSRPVLTFGEPASADLQSTYHGYANGRYRVGLKWTGTGVTRELDWDIGGRHQADNAAAAAAAATAMGVNPDVIVAGLMLAKLPGMRMAMATCDGITWANDAYNSNPESARASVAWFAERQRKDAAKGTTTYLVLGDMRELGPECTPVEHLSLLEWARNQAPEATVITVGSAIQAAAASCGLRNFPDAETAGNWLKTALRPGDRVLLKGSRGIGLERVLAICAPAALPPKGH